MDYCAAKGWITISDRFAISTWLTLCLCPCWCADRRCSCIVCTRILLCVWFVRVYPFGHHNSKVHLAKKPRNTPAESADTTKSNEESSLQQILWNGEKVGNFCVVERLKICETCFFLHLFCVRPGHGKPSVPGIRSRQVYMHPQFTWLTIYSFIFADLLLFGKENPIHAKFNQRCVCAAPEELVLRDFSPMRGSSNFVAALT